MEDVSEILKAAIRKHQAGKLYNQIQLHQCSLHNRMTHLPRHIHMHLSGQSPNHASQKVSTLYKLRTSLNYLSSII